MDNKKYLVYGDIHHRWERAEKTFARYPDHTIIMVGDYFDDFQDGTYDALGTARWLKSSLKKNNRIHLLGNHDAAYAFCHNGAMWCPGYTPEKNRAIHQQLNEYDFRNLLLFHAISRGRDKNPILISHAGFTLPNLYGFHFRELCKVGGKYRHLHELTVDEHLHYLHRETFKFFEAARANGEHHFMYQGSRMGLPGHGGPFWVHMTDFWPIKGIDQIVGHTSTKVIRSGYYPNKKDCEAVTYFIDTHGDEFLLIEDGIITKVVEPVESKTQIQQGAP